MGVEAGLRYYVSDRLSTTANVNLIGVDTIKSNPTDPPEATAFNSASVRATAGVDYQDADRTGGLTVRYVNGYDFRGGVNFGRIPSFATIDLSATYRIASSPLKVLFQAQNLFACVGGTSTPPAAGISANVPAAYVGGRQCGFGQSHVEMLNMPAIGAMVFLGLRAEGALPR
jgi:hypothetical protein